MLLKETPKCHGKKLPAFGGQIFFLLSIMEVKLSGYLEKKKSRGGIPGQSYNLNSQFSKDLNTSTKQNPTAQYSF